MENVNKYIISVCFSIIFCILAEALMPSERYAKIIRMLLGVFIVYTLISPVRNLINPSNYTASALSFDITESDTYKIYEEKTAEAFGEAFNFSLKNAIKVDIENNFHEKDIVVKINREDNSVIISGANAENAEGICEYISNNYVVKAYFTE